MSNPEIVVCNPVRTPVGRYGGALRSIDVAGLGVAAVQGLIERSGISPDLVDDLILGNCNPSSEAPALGRVVALDAGLPVTTAGLQIDRRCGSGLQSILYGAMQVAAGASSVVIAGGAESMSNVTFYSTDARWGAGRESLAIHDGLERARQTAGGHRYVVEGGMLETAENLRAAYDISRVEQDALAAESHRRAVQAQDSGAFEDEIVPVVTGDSTVTVDEHPRRDTSMERLASLRPVRLAVDPHSTVTAGNSSGQNDAASVCLITTREKADSLGLTPFVRILSWATAGVEPRVMGIGPVGATEKALAMAGLTLADMGLIELNEAFAAQVLACTREWGFTDKDFDRLNVSGSGISLGHPVGATGARMVTTLSHEMRRRGENLGLVTMCIGGGQGLAAVVELVQ